MPHCFSAMVNLEVDNHFAFHFKSVFCHNLGGLDVQRQCPVFPRRRILLAGVLTLNDSSFFSSQDKHGSVPGRKKQANISWRLMVSPSFCWVYKRECIRGNSNDTLDRNRKWTPFKVAASCWEPSVRPSLRCVQQHEMHQWVEYCCFYVLRLSHAHVSRRLLSF